MRAFLLFVLCALPLYGQLYPKRVPFLLAFRPYAGNWRFTWHIVDNRHRHKLRRLRTLEGVFVSESARYRAMAQPQPSPEPLVLNLVLRLRQSAH